MRKVLYLLALWILATIGYSQQSDTIYFDIDGIKIHTVLTTPVKVKKPPLAIIIAGSGPTDLNGNQPKMVNNSLKFLSDELVSNKIATLRFDKRAIAKSSYSNFREDDLSIDNFASDIIKLTELAKSKGFEKIYLIGHSEGSLLALIALNKINAAGFVSLAGAGYPADIILKKQLKPQLPPAMFTEAEAIIDSLKNGYLVKKLPPYLNILFRASVQPYIISWFKYDPAVLICNLKCPVIIIQGDNDLQIKIEDAQNLSKALPLAKLKIIPEMNHILKTVGNNMQENINSYNNPGLPVNAELVANITGFINDKK